MSVRARALMVQGTASHVGKTVLVAALCRYFRRRGIRVAPFKAQNMALNAWVTAEGGEIGWAQAMQAEAAGLEPSIDMNPLLLKPQTGGSQVIVHGRVWATLSARDYYQREAPLREAVELSYDRLARRHELIVIEGAGSPAEPNFLRRDLVNMAVARLADAPVVLAGDVDRGGVFASFVGTLEILPFDDRCRVAGFVLNRFRGDVGLLRPALDYLERRTRRPVLGVVPYLADLLLPEEDSVALDERRSGRDRPAAARRGPGPVRVAVVRLPHVANFTDFLPLDADPALEVAYVERPSTLGQPGVVILPGTKDTLADLRWLHETGWVAALLAHHARGGAIGGICGGFQMLGTEVADPLGLEGGGRAAGLGLLPARTRVEPGKVTRQVRARLAEGDEPTGPSVEAYEIHLGRTEVATGVRPVFFVADDGGWRAEGARSADGRVWGTYLHGSLDTPGARRALLATATVAPQSREEQSAEPLDFRALRERQYDRLADVVRDHLDTAALERLAGTARTETP